ncbi:MAG: FAD-dependent oxidoreductase [Acidobacteriaceae bacterium]
MEATDIYDLIVCGGGPAGAAAAISVACADSRLRVLLIEAGSFPRHKVCGEFFSPEAAEILQSLLGTDDDNGARLLNQSIRISRIGLHAASHGASFALPRSAFSITRHDLDDGLWRRAQQLGVECLDRTRVLSISRSECGFTVASSGGGFQAQCVINATGRWSEINNSSDGRTNLIGIKAHFETDGALAPEPSCDLHFFPGGYIGIQPISPCAINASALVDAAKYRDMPAVLQAAGLGLVARAWKPLFPPITCPPVRFAAPLPVDPISGVLNCGDAAAFIDPFAGDGMSLALHSGVLAGAHAVRILAGASISEIAARYDRAYRRRFAHTFRSAARMRRFAFAPEWMQSLAIAALRVPYVSQAALKSTRAA